MQPQLTPEQYELVLKYIEATGQEDFQAAMSRLREYRFNLNTAVNARFNPQDLPRQNPRHLMDQEPNQNDQEVIRKYIQFIQQENQSTNIFSTTFNFVKNFTVGLVKLLSQIILPQAILKKILRSKFYVLYKDDVKVDVQDHKLVRLLMNTKEKSYKSCFVVISPQAKADCIVELLNKNDIVNKVRESFLFAGFVQGDHQIEPIRDQRPPEIVICRYNIYKELIIVKRIIGEQAIRDLTVPQLQNFLEEGRVIHKRDKNVLVKYRNFFRRQLYGGQMQIEEEEEEEEASFISRQEDMHHIRQQNEEYERIAQEEARRFEQMRHQEEKKKKELQMLEQKEQERQCRKMSIPDEPQSGEIIRFSFRCPDGSNIARCFSAEQKVELLYHWVETNQKIELEDNKKREFEIMYGFPPSALSSQKDKQLRQVFDSDQEKLLIREL